MLLLKEKRVIDVEGEKTPPDPVVLLKFYLDPFFLEILDLFIYSF